MVEISPENFQKCCKIVDSYKKSLNYIKEDTKFLSNLSSTLEHPDFKRLVKEGPKIVTWLFHDMIDQGTDWTHLMLLGRLFPEISELIPSVCNGDFLRLIHFWLGWYISSDYNKNSDVYYGLVT